MSLSSLPFDILFEIFSLFDDLQHLHAVVSTNRSLHQAFWEHRARLLQRVFRNQVVKQVVKYYADDPITSNPSSGTRSTLRVPYTGIIYSYINPVMYRYEKTDLPDRLILRSTAWTTFLEFKLPELVFISLGEELMSLCRDVGREDLALSYAAELWKHVSTRQTFEYLKRRSWYTSDRFVDSFAQNLAARYYHDFKRPEDAARTILQRYSMELKDRDYKLFSYVLKYTRDMPDPSEVIIFFQERAATERENLINNGLTKGELHWTFCLTLLLSELGKFQDAICVFNNTHVLYSDERADPTTLEGLSRRLIKSLKNQKHYDEAFTIYRQILTLLSRMYKTTDTQYMAWAKQYISELYLIGRSDEALAVEEQCWNRIRERLTIRKDNSSVYVGRGAAWALSRSYEKRGQPEKATRVRWEYETLARACMKPGSRVIWPGEDVRENLVGKGGCQEENERFVPFEAVHGSAIQV